MFFYFRYLYSVHYSAVLNINFSKSNKNIQHNPVYYLNPFGIYLSPS